MNCIGPSSAFLKRVCELSGGELEWTDGMLYPLLHRLGRLGYTTTEWRSPPGGRRRRYCSITDDGRAALAKQQRQWMTVTRALDGVWKDPGTADGDRTRVTMELLPTEVAAQRSENDRASAPHAQRAVAWRS